MADAVTAAPTAPSDTEVAAESEAAGTAPAPRSYFARSQGEVAEEAPAVPLEAVAEAVTEPVAAPEPVVERIEAVAAADVAPALPEAAEVEAVEAVEAAEPAHGGAPEATPFVLPLEQLGELADAAGLQWIQTDAERAAAVRAAIAAEPQPIHVPRERPPVIELDDGPLILVETRKDLGSMQLPFEQSTH